MTHYTIYTRPDCGYCVRAKTMLRARGLSYSELDAVASSAELQERVLAATGAGTNKVPQIFCGDVYIGGFDQLKASLEKPDA